MRYLLDTNVISHLLRNPQGPVQQVLSTHREADVFTSVIVACELRFGAHKRRSAVLSDRVDRFLATIAVAPLDPAVAEHYARIREATELAGAPIGASDLLIAAHALSQQAVLVTDDVAEFARVPELTIENWVR